MLVTIFRIAPKALALWASAFFLSFAAPASMAQDNEGASEDQATTEANEEESSATEEKSPEEEKICRRVAMSGSRMKMRVCQTQAAWDRKDHYGSGDLNTRAKETMLPAPNPLGSGPGNR